MYKHKLAATYHCNKKHPRKRWQWKHQSSPWEIACFVLRWSSVPHERDILFGKRPLSNIKIIVSTIWLKRFPSCKEKFERFWRYQRLLKRGRKKASEFVLLRKRIKQFPLHHVMEDVNWTEVTQCSQENQSVLPHKTKHHKYLHRPMNHLQGAFKHASSHIYCWKATLFPITFKLKTDYSWMIYEAMTISTLVSFSLLSIVHFLEI